MGNREDRVYALDTLVALYYMRHLSAFSADLNPLKKQTNKQKNQTKQKNYKPNQKQQNKLLDLKQQIY